MDSFYSSIWWKYKSQSVVQHLSSGPLGVTEEEALRESDANLFFPLLFALPLA